MHWPIFLLCAAAYGVLFASGFLSDLVPLAQLVIAGLICLVGVVASLLKSARHGVPPTVAPWIAALVGFAVVSAWTYREEGRILALSLLEREPVVATASVASLRQEVMLMRAWDGHFRAVAEVNGAPVGLLIDTGASILLLRHDDARRIGFDETELNFNMPVTTANGRSFVAPVTFKSVVIGGIVVEDGKGAVAQPDELHTSLLGMSYIEKLHEAVFRADRLILRY